MCDVTHNGREEKFIDNLSRRDFDRIVRNKIMIFLKDSRLYRRFYVSYLLLIIC